MAEKILIIGAGNMGGALAKGLTASGAGLEVRVHDQNATRLSNLASAAGIHPAPDLGTSGLDDDAVVLCVKPQDLGPLGATLKRRLKDDGLLVSILAGVTIQDLAEAFEFSGAIVRAMPNICATVDAAATAICENGKLGTAQRDLAVRIFDRVGTVDWTKESLMDAVTGLSGSGPAYLYMVIEALTDGGVKMGLPRELASRLSAQTVLGSARLVLETGLHPAILKEQVTTPGGTTINAIHELEDRGLRAMLISAVETATKRSADLRKKS